MRSGRTGLSIDAIVVRSFVTALLSVTIARADLPPAGADTAGTTAKGFAFVGTQSPFTVPSDQLDPQDVAALATTRTDAADGSSSRAEVHGGIGDVVHFGPGLTQLFAATAGVDGIVESRIGVVHLLAASQATTEPLDYAAPFPGALGSNPFFGKSSVGVSGGFTDIVTIPATNDAPNAGMLTTVTLNVLVNCTTNGDYPNLVGHVGATLSDAQGHVLGEIVANAPPNPVQLSSGCPFGAANSGVHAPVLTPLALHFSVGLSANMGSGPAVPFRTLAGGLYYAPSAGGAAAWDALDTAVATLNTAGGAGAIGSTGRDYGYAAYTSGQTTDPTIVTTTTTTTTTTFVPPSTLPSCSGFCGDGVQQAECGEVCDCPPVAEGQVGTVCDAADAVPPLATGCARCVGCQIDLAHCATTTTTTTPSTGATTTTSPGSGGATTTTIPAACAGLTAIPAAACRLHTFLAAPLCGSDPIPKKTDARLRAGLGAAAKLLDAAPGHSGKRLAHLLAHARRRLDRVGALTRKAGKAKHAGTRISPACVATIVPTLGAVESDLPAR